MVVHVDNMFIVKRMEQPHRNAYCHMCICW